MTDASSSIVLSGRSLVHLPDITVEERDDVLDCLNYSETRADRKFDRHQQWTSWINRYQAGLYNNGFSISGALLSNTFLVSHLSEVPEVMRSVIQDSGHPQLAALGRQALERMLSSSHAESFFRDWFNEGLSENLQVVPCQRTDSGGIDVMICGLRMETQTVAGGWFSASRSAMKISVNGGAYLFERKAYAPYRATVVSSLERYARYYLQSLATD